MTGIVMAGIGVGTLAIAPLSTWLISLYGWRTANVIIGLIVLVIGLAAADLRRYRLSMGLTPLGQDEIEGNEPTAGAHGLNLRKSAGTWQFW